MLVFIDESGCTGFKLQKGSTNYFVLAMVIFKDFKEAENCSHAISALKKRLKVKKEFKFNKTHPNVKEAFFIGVRKYKFIVRAIVIDKYRMFNTYFLEDKLTFYNNFIQLLVKDSSDILQNAIVKIDGGGDRLSKNKLFQHLRQQLGPNVIKKFSFVDSKKDNLIQLVDMVVGAIARRYKDHKDGDRWIKLLGERIENIWEFNRPCNLV
jgi:hypothetical protein